ncbi:MAG: efflux RND transporter periplasmic adaptor subunit [Planctomycetota bacterium]
MYRSDTCFARVLALALVSVGIAPGFCLAQGFGPTSVLVAPVEQQEIARTIQLVGTAHPRIRTIIAAEVEGLVEKLTVDRGDRVEKGRLLCRLRDVSIRCAFAESQARQAELKALEAVAAAELRKSEFERERTSRLYENEQCAEKEYLDAQADRDAAQARCDQARHAVAAQVAVVARLADELARTEIKAPCDGYIVDKRTEIGSWVERGGAVVELVDLATVRVRVDVPEAVIAYCRTGEPVQVTVDALGNRAFAGKVSRVVPDADAQARTFPVEIDVPNPEGELKAGMFVRAAVPAGPRKQRLVVSKDAVVVLGPASMVYVVRPGESGSMAMPLPVEIVAEIVDHVAVVAPGLAPGDQVVIRGNENMLGRPTPVIVSAPPGAKGSQQPDDDGPAAASQPSHGG